MFEFGSSSNSTDTLKECDCKLPPKVRTVRVGKNVGKKFYGCLNWPDGNCGYFKWKDDGQMTLEINHSKELNERLVEKLSKAEGKIQKLKVKNQKLEELLVEKDAAIKKMEQECNMLKIELCKAANGEKFAKIAIFVSWLFFAIVMYGK